ncbi:MAG TPA: VOC family protein [Tepidisphaeraceae bacterium]|nr:VOC family protein [Tepidisphaeraceae bacterium]
MELEPSSGIQPLVDRRPRMDQPLPVKLVAVEDVRLPAPAGVEVKLDAFYVELLGFERMPPDTEMNYRAENVALRFDIQEQPVEHENLRPQGIEVLSLPETELKLIGGEYEYVRQRGILSGTESIVMRDPAGNWIELVELRSL